MYIPGRRRTDSKPSKTVICLALYSEAEAALAFLSVCLADAEPLALDFTGFLAGIRQKFGTRKMSDCRRNNITAAVKKQVAAHLSELMKKR
jgi:hypothetical protein